METHIVLKDVLTKIGLLIALGLGILSLSPLAIAHADAQVDSMLCNSILSC
jgi:hypothetical protein